MALNSPASPRPSRRRSAQPFGTLGARTIATWVGLWFVLACLLSALLYVGMSSGDRSLGQRLQAHGVAVTGTFIRNSPNGHGEIEYSYIAADGHRYVATSPAEDPTTPAARTAGGPVRVVYDSRNPGISCNCDPRQLLKGTGWLSNSVLGAIFALFPTALLAARSRIGTHPVRADPGARAGRRLRCGVRAG